MPHSVVIEPIVAELTLVAGVLGLHGEDAEAFDYACGKARAEAIDRLLIAVVEERGWSLFDDGVVDRVSVQHEGKKRARILIDGAPASRWWQDRLTTTESHISWCFAPIDEAAA